MSSLQIDISHFKGRYDKGVFSAALSKEVIFTENSTISSTTVKRVLRRDKLIPYCCTKCPNTGEWLGQPLSLQLDHINGNNTDNRLVNLRWLCPNCHTQTPTYAGRRLVKHLCPTCGKPTSATGVRCRKCHLEAIRINDWPSTTELQRLVWTAPLWKLADAIGHSRNDLVEQCRKVGVSLPKHGYWQKRGRGKTHEEALAAPVPRPKAKHIAPEVASLMRRMKTEGKSCREIGRELGFHHTNVARVCRKMERMAELASA